MKIIYSTIFTFYLVVYSSSIFAETIELSCDYKSGEVQGKCRVSETMLFSGIQKTYFWEGDYETTYSLTYRFPCQGHETGIVLRSGDGKINLLFTDKAGSSRKITVNGFLPITLVDNDPNKTYRATLVGECGIYIDSITSEPSINTLYTWQNEAKTEVKKLRLTINYYTLARDLADLDKWLLDKMTLIKKKIEDLLLLDPGNLHLKMLLETVQSVIDKRPVPFSQEEIADAQTLLMDLVKKELDDEVIIAQQMQERFKTYKQKIDDELKEVLETL